MRSGVMTALYQTAGHTQNPIDVHVHVHAVYCKTLVLFLKLLGQLVRVTNLHVVQKEHVAIVAYPIKHLKGRINYGSGNIFLLLKFIPFHNLVQRVLTESTDRA